MSEQKITVEEQNKILLYSASVLPDNPSERGFTPKAIKAFFYKYISVFIEILNEKLMGVEQSSVAGINEHNISASAHDDIRNVIEALIDKDIELGNEIASSQQKHNNDKQSHPILIGEIEKLSREVESAYNLASGKSKIYPCSDAYDMLNHLNANLNVGDKLVLAQENIPDFILFEKDSQRTDAIPFSQMELMLGLEFEPGKKYISNGYLLVATESGIDTSLFAKQQELDEIKVELLTKEAKKALKEETAETVTLTSDTEYNLGLRTSVVLALPEEIPNEFEVIVNFRSGTVATAFDAPNSIVFTQDDCYEGRLTPVANRIYEMNIKNVGGVLIAKVGCCDYEVVE